MFSQKKPYSAVTVTIERLTSEAIPVDDFSGIPDLVEVVNLQDTGPSEASRAIRKKLKYGNLHRQLRALTILDGLIQNAGPRFQRTFADEALLERLRFCGTAGLSDPEVRKKCTELFAGWAAEYKNTPGMGQVAKLYKELPRRKHVVTQEKSKVIRETDNPFGEEEDDDDDKPSPAGPSGGHSRTTSLSNPLAKQGGLSTASHDAKKKKKDKKSKKSKPFNLAAEQEQMKTHLAEASIAATNLTNTLQTINRERERISDNQIAVLRFEACKQLRRKILRYIHHVESEQWLGSLLNANDALVTALMTFEQLDRSIDADSDSDDELAEQAHLYRMAIEKQKGKEPSSPTTSPPPPVAGLAGLYLGSPQGQQEQQPLSSPSRPPPPPRPSAATKPAMFSPRLAAAAAAPDSDAEQEEEDEDEENPFADRNAVSRGE
ncbi:hypothetical protein C8A01DRAFT_32757 [Parachaetomium inaequale]|uniref:VHS domain-containing protein n=1 Tax=Parachaetomium inaequale TaxID=2588326 RepID=A0AAN6SV07_9PEZI|nr:hypothetical protein C8A01DRAFT_32757 [Parachaetomium inaequale]